MFDGFGRVGFRREDLHDLAAAQGHAVLIQRVVSLLALVARIDQASIAQDRQMMRHRRLRDIRLLETSLGDPIKRIIPSEVPILKKLRRVGA